MDYNIKKIATEIFKTENIAVKYRLKGGMSNYSYVIEVNNLLYTIRVPGEFSEYFVNREHELRDLFLFTKLNLTNQTLYFNLADGVKISKYVDGFSLNEVEDRCYQDVADLLYKIHQSPLLCETDYNPFLKLEKYENNLIECGYVHNLDYIKTKNIFMKFEKYLENIKKVLCHNDSQPSNFIKDNYNNLIIVDFEFVGNNDYLYDIACFGNMKIEDALKLLYLYPHQVTDDILLRFYLWRTFQCLQWYNVALFKNMKGMSEKLNLDFKKIADNYLINANIFLKEVLSNNLSNKIINN